MSSEPRTTDAMTLEEAQAFAAEIRRRDIRAALTLLSEKFDHEARAYRRKCRDNRAERYEDMAAAIRNHIEWTCDQMRLEG